MVTTSVPVLILFQRCTSFSGRTMGLFEEYNTNREPLQEEEHKMDNFDKKVDITKNIKMLEWLKTELVSSVAALFRALLKGTRETILDALTNIILISYLLGRRLGMSFARIDLHLESKIRVNIDEGHQSEKWYGDLSELLRHLDACRPERKRREHFE